MLQNEIEYFARRAEEARKAAEANEGIVRQTHEKFATAYADPVAQANVARATVDDLLGQSPRLRGRLEAEQIPSCRRRWSGFPHLMI